MPRARPVPGRCGSAEDVRGDPGSLQKSHQPGHVSQVGDLRGSQQGPEAFAGRIVIVEALQAATLIADEGYQDVEDIQSFLDQAERLAQLKTADGMKALVVDVHRAYDRFSGGYPEPGAIRELIRELGREHSVILSTHILPEVQAVCDRVGIIREGEGIAANVLRRLGIEFDRIQKEIEATVSPMNGPVSIGEIPFTPRAKKVLELSLEEASNLGHTYIGTEHLLLGLIREDEGIAAQVLRNLKVKLDDVRDEVLELLGADPNSVSARLDWTAPADVGRSRRS